MGRLAGKVALVTGAGQGIGRAIAETFAAEGAYVLAFDLDAARIERTAQEIDGGKGMVKAFVGDIARREDVQNAVQRCVARFGGLDILAANAGINCFKPFLEIEDPDWQRVVDVNLTGTFY